MSKRMKVNPAIQKTMLKIFAIFLGAGSILFVYFLHDPGYFITLFLFALLAFGFSFHKNKIPWALSFLLLFSNYVAGLFCIPGWGELLPIDLIILLVYWGILGLISKLGIYIGAKYNVPHA
jgi:hypothetical protein